MLFSTVKHWRKLPAVLLFLLIFLTMMPLITAEASVGLQEFRALDRIDFIMLEWKTGQELNNLGFNLYRSETGVYDDAVKINNFLIPAQGGAQGAEYEWPDYDVEIGVLYTYWIEDIDTSGNETVHHELPASGMASGGNTIPTIPSGGGNNSTSTPTPTRTPTATPSPTTQSGATATPSRTPTTQPTSSTSNTGATATNVAEVQLTAVSNNAAATPTPQDTVNTTVETAVEETSQGQNGEEPTPIPETVNNTTTSGTEETTSVTLSEGPTETESEANNAIANAIGQNGTTSQGNAPQNESPSDSSNRSTMVLMALIASVILLIAGGGGIVVMLLNRNKQAAEELSE